jgi:hypothetical protein
MVKVRCTEGAPPAGEAFASIRYRNHWFWVDNRDTSSKKELGFLMILFTLVESGGTVAPPVFTISKQFAVPFGASSSWPHFREHKPPVTPHGASNDQSAPRPRTASSSATVMLSGHCESIGVCPNRSLRKVDQ